jgi:Transglutaminase-like superfamily
METSTNVPSAGDLFRNEWMTSREDVLKLLRASKHADGWNRLVPFFENEMPESNTHRYVCQEFLVFASISAAALGRGEDSARFLQQAIDRGFSDYYELQSGELYRPLREVPGYHEMLLATKKYGDHFGILGEFSCFRKTPDAEPVAWRYESFDSEALRAFALEFNLDEVTGRGSDWLRARRLMLWIHTQVRHNGMQIPPTTRDGAALLRMAINEHQGLNCWMMATIFNQCCLASGLFSRLVTCLSANPNDGDCHVVNAVWSHQLERWMYLDATHDAFFLDEVGEPLGFMEVRDALASRKALRVNPSLNWNGFLRDPSDYFSYMAKNLFKVRCPLESTVGYEGLPVAEREYVTLLPVGASDDSSARGCRNRSTNSPETFWRAPANATTPAR